MSDATLIRKADYVIAWDESAGGHCYLRDADVVFDGNLFTFVGHDYTGDAARTIDGGGLMVMPGFVNLHCHPHSEPGNKGVTEDAGSRQFGQSTLYEFLNILNLDEAGAAAAARVAWSEMLKSGVTTVADLSLPSEGWIDALAATGLRGVLCPMVRSGGWYTSNGRTVEYAWNEQDGMQKFAWSLAIIDEARKHPSGRLDGMVGPAQIDTCTEALLRDALAAARERGITLQVHAAQSKVEFEEMTRRHRMTPIEFMHEIGLLGPDTIIGHGIFLNDHPWLHWPQGRDFEILRDSGAAVAHCPTNFSRRGVALNHLRRYLDAGIVVGLGTDTYPHNMINEIHIACIAARITSGEYTAGRTSHAFDAATLGGAAAMKRTDIGRIAKGAKADFSLVDLAHPYMRPLRDPLRSLVFSADDRAIRDVYVDGQCVVRDGEVLTIDVEAALDELAAAQARSLTTVPERDWAQRGIDDLSPMVYPQKGGLG